MTLQLLNLLEPSASGSKTKLNLLILTPFHDEDSSQFGWDGGPALVPAARLAANQINNRSDILPEHELVLIEKSISCHDLVGREGRLLDTYAKTVIYGEQNILGIVGPACSVNAIDLGGLSVPQRNPLVQVTIGTSPTLENRTRFPFTFSTLSSGNAFLIAMKKLAVQEQWNSMGIILDVSSTFWVDLYKSVPGIFDDTLYNITTFRVTDGEANFNANQDITRSNLRVFIVLLSRNTADKFMCFAYKSMPQLIYKQTQWFFIERSILINPNDQSSCTNEELMGAFEKSVFLQYQLVADDSKTQIVSKQNYDEFNDSYTAEVNAYSGEQGIDVFGQYPHGISYAPVFYDAVWTLGLSLDQAIRKGRLEHNLTSRFRPGSVESKEIARAIKENILTLDVFQGASGMIKFDNNTGQTHSVITFKQVVSGKLNLIGTSSDYINGSFIKDYFPKKYVGIQTGVAAIGFIFIGLLLVLTISIHLVNLWQSKDPLIKANSPRLNNLIFIGCYLLLFGMVLLTVIDWKNFRLVSSNPQLVGDTLCNVYIWLIQTGFTLIVATVLMKTFRIYRIFIHFTRPGGLLLRDSVLALCVLGLVSPVVVILISISVTSTEHIWKEMTFINDLTESNRAICVPRIWELLPILYVGVLLFLSLGLSLPLRHINRQFKTVKSISILAFCQILITWFGYPFVFIATLQSVNWDQHIHYILLMFILSGILLSSLLLLFAPPVVSLIKNKWKQSVTDRKLQLRTKTDTFSTLTHTVAV